MQKTIPIEYGKYYHIYNRGINGCNIFDKKDNYSYFLELYEKYIPVIANTFAYCLMPNHFHFLIQIKEEKGIEHIPRQPLTLPVVNNPGSGLYRKAVKNPGSGLMKKYKPSNQFSHLFNAYSQAYNKQNNRHGSLFEKPFKRKHVNSEYDLKKLMFYIHNNPVGHGFMNNHVDYEWSSYHSLISDKQTYLEKKQVFEWFDNIDNFIFYHRQQHEIKEIEKYIFD